MPEDNFYHDGERAVQDRVNVTAAAHAMQRLISDRLPVTALAFIENLAMAVVASRDEQGYIWASVIFGNPGFLHAPDLHTLNVNIPQAIIANDPLWTNIHADPEVGLLLIDLGSRRRLRINGTLAALSPARWTLSIKQAYANCPRYIQRRLLTIKGAVHATDIKASRHGKIINDYHQQLISRADTFYVASAHPERGLDASHRGGATGFIQVLPDLRLRIPDYPGNNMFNTLGNIYSNPDVGIVFIDYQRNQLVQLTGKASIIWQCDQPATAAAGTQRYWEFECASWRESAIPLDMAWTFIDASPFNPDT
jgi:hypothetical protein